MNIREKKPVVLLLKFEAQLKDSIIIDDQHTGRHEKNFHCLSWHRFRSRRSGTRSSPAPIQFRTMSMAILLRPMMHWVAALRSMICVSMEQPQSCIVILLGAFRR